MTLKEFLEKNPIINPSALARLLWPHLTAKEASKRMSAKKREAKNGKSKQRIIEDETLRSIEILQKLSENIQEFKDKNKGV